MFNPVSPRLTNISFLPTISMHNQEKRFEESFCSPKEKCFDLLSKSLNEFLMAMYGEMTLENLGIYLDTGA